MIRRVVLSVAVATLLAGCGADGEPIPPTKGAQAQGVGTGLAPIVAPVRIE